MENVINIKENILNKKINELNEISKYNYEYKITLEDILPVTLRAKTIDKYIIQIKSFDDINQLYFYINGILDGLNYDK